MNQLSTDALSVMIDVSSLPYGRGVSRYTSNLAQALAARRDIDLTLFGYSSRQREKLQQWMSEYGSHVGKQLWPLPPSVMHKAWQWVGGPNPAWRSSASVYHAWDWQLAPVGQRVGQVVTIHDLAHRLFPGSVPARLEAQYQLLLDTLEEETHIQIIAVSAATKKDIVNLTSIDPERIHVVMEALPEEAKVVPAEEHIEKTLHKFSLEKPYFLTVGTTEPRKNLNRIIQAWRTMHGDFDLVIAGAQGWDTLPQEEGIHYLGYVDGFELASLYRRAQALVYTSLYEGFGLPILEAFWHECPVITSLVSSMPEVAGKAAELVDPYDVEGIAASMEKIANENEEQKKQRQDRMSRQLHKFSWERAAEETLAVYHFAKRI